MSKDAEIAEALQAAQELVHANYRMVMAWFEKAVQVTLKYEVELDPRARRTIVENLQEAWGEVYFRTPSLAPPGPRSDPDYTNWIMKHIMYLTHPNNDNYDDWANHAFRIMNECREHLGMPKLDQIPA